MRKQPRRGSWPANRLTLSSSAGPPEEEVQRSIIEFLEVLGYTVLQTSHRVKLARCPTCETRFRPMGGYGASLGVPDLLVRHKGWPAGSWLGIEVKRPHKWSWTNPAQAELWEQGGTAIAHSVEDAARAVLQYSIKLDRPVHATIALYARRSETEVFKGMPPL